MIFGKSIKSGLVASLVSAAVVVGAGTGVVHAAATYTIDSAAGCAAFLAGIGATGSSSGTECTIADDLGVLPLGDTVTIAAGWTLTGAFTNNSNILNYGELHVTRAMTSRNTVTYAGSTLRIDAPFTDSGGIFTNGSTSVYINAPFVENGGSYFIDSSVAIAADVTINGMWILIGLGTTVTVRSGTVTNYGAYDSDNGASTTLIEAPVCGQFVNGGQVQGGSIVDECTPKVDVEKGPAQNDPTPTGPITFVVTWGEDVTGFDISDLELTTTGTVVATIDSITGGPRQYTVAVLATGEGNVSLSVKPGAVTDAADNPSAASTSIDNTVTLAADLPPGEPEDFVPTGGGSATIIPALLVLLAGLALAGLGRRRSEVR